MNTDPPANREAVDSVDRAFGTDPLDEQSGLALPPSDPVTVFRLVGHNVELPLSPNKRTFTLGAAQEPEVEVTIPPLFGARVSRLHALVQRRGNRLWIVDQQSTNGIYLDDRREPSFEIGAGDSFRVADVKLLALDEPLRVLRPHVQWTIGLSAHAAVDAALELIAGGRPLLLLGKSGCDQLALARQVHRASARRGREFVEAPAKFETRAEQTGLLARASRGTIFVELSASTGPLPAFFVGHLFGGDATPGVVVPAPGDVAATTTYHVRPVVSAPSLEVAEEHLGKENARRLAVINVPPLTERRSDIPRLIDTLLIKAESTRRVAELGAENVAGLMEYAWPQNLDDVRRQMPRLRALLEQGTLRGAARVLNVSPQAVREALERIGVRVRTE
jgi:hypothetical protein